MTKVILILLMLSTGQPEQLLAGQNLEQILILPQPTPKQPKRDVDDIPVIINGG